MTTDPALGIICRRRRLRSRTPSHRLPTNGGPPGPPRNGWGLRFSKPCPLRYVHHNPATFIDWKGLFKAKTAKEYRREFGYDTVRSEHGLGQHVVPAGSLVGQDISHEMGRIFGRASILDIVLPHTFDSHHNEYNKLIKAELPKWAAANNIDLSRATADDAKKFLKHIVNAPHLNRFNETIITLAIRGGLRPHMRRLDATGPRTGTGGATTGILDKIGIGVIVIEALPGYIEAIKARRDTNRCLSEGLACRIESQPR